ncbi:MAG: hypothetical protein WA045_11795 [Nitrospira sp.]
MNLEDEVDLKAFEHAYIVCMLWSSNDESTPSGGEPLDANYDIDDIDLQTRQAITAECREFCQMVVETLDITVLPGWTPEQAGHDFWLTRNGHGAGFWDRYSGGHVWEALGDWLKDAVGWRTDFPEQDPYVGDDGKIYIS